MLQVKNSVKHIFPFTARQISTSKIFVSPIKDPMPCSNHLKILGFDSTPLILTQIEDIFFRNIVIVVPRLVPVINTFSFLYIHVLLDNRRPKYCHNESTLSVQWSDYYLLLQQIVCIFIQQSM